MGNIPRRQKLLLTLILVVLVQAIEAANPANAPYRFGVFPYLSPLKMDAVFSPVGQKLSVLLDRRVNFRTASTMDTFVNRLSKGHYDFAILQPVLYPLVTDNFGYVAIAMSEEPLSAQVMVLDSSPLKSVGDLKGKTIATPPLFGPIVHLTEHELERAGLAPGQDVFLHKKKSIEACFQQMVIGRVDACLAPSFSVPKIKRSLGRQLRTLLQSGNIPNRLLVVRKALPSADQTRILNAFLALGDSSSGDRLLEAMNTKGFVAFSQDDYKQVRTTLQHMNNAHHYRQ